MAEAESALTLVLRTGESGGQLSEDATRSIAEDLESLAGISIQHLRTSVDTPGAKAMEGNLVGLIVAMSGAGALLPTALTVIRDWLVRQRPTTEVEIEFKDIKVRWSGATPPQEVASLIAQVGGRV